MRLALLQGSASSCAKKWFEENDPEGVAFEYEDTGMNRIGGTLKGLRLAGFKLLCIRRPELGRIATFPNDLVTKEAVNC